MPSGRVAVWSEMVMSETTGLSTEVVKKMRPLFEMNCDQKKKMRVLCERRERGKELYVGVGQGEVSRPACHEEGSPWVGVAPKGVLGHRNRSRKRLLNHGNS